MTNFTQNDIINIGSISSNEPLPIPPNGSMYLFSSGNGTNTFLYGVNEKGTIQQLFSSANVTGFVINGTSITGEINLVGSTGIRFVSSGNNPNTRGIAVGFNSGEPINMGSLIIIPTGIATRPMLTYFESGWGATVLGPSLWQKQITCLLPQAGTTMTSIGDSMVSVGSITNSASEWLGDYTDIVPTTTGAFSGCMITTAGASRVYRGSISNARNGWFFCCKFFLTGSNSYGSISGSRIAIGLSDQPGTTNVASSDPPGNRFSLIYQWASGGTQAGNFMTQWYISTKNNTTQATGSTNVQFATGFYRFISYCKPAPDNNTIAWELFDFSRNSGAAGLITANLPLGGTALKPFVAVCNPSGVKGIGVMALYVETPSNPLE
jgi:hypothetical protein